MAFNKFQVSADPLIPAEVQLPQISFSEGDFFLKIERIAVAAPVVAGVDGSDKEIYFEELKRGVAQMAGTANPDEKGNLVIFGHSNFYPDDPGAFKQVFRNLNQLQTDDRIIIRYKGQDYNYRVVKQEIVEPKDTWVITAPYDLTLITCWPPGTIEKRLIIFANKI